MSGDVYRFMGIAGENADGSGDDRKILVSGGAACVVDAMPGVSVIAILPNITNTRISLSFTSCVSLLIEYIDLPGSAPVVGQYLKAVLGADSDSDAIGKMAIVPTLAAPGSGWDLVPKNSSKRWNYSVDTPLRRLDLQAALAVGAETTMVIVTATER